MKTLFAASLAAAALVLGDAKASDMILAAGAPVANGHGQCWRTKAVVASDVLFDFDGAALREEGRAELDRLARELAACRSERIVVRAHADRIGGSHYNQLLSARRAWAIRDHLVARGLPQARLVLEARGASDPVTGARCDGLAGGELVACLQPDRRVEIELVATR
jgi:OOP family OmpA-OmpF porin